MTRVRTKLQYTATRTKHPFGTRETCSVLSLVFSLATRLPLGTGAISEPTTVIVSFCLMGCQQVKRQLTSCWLECRIKDLTTPQRARGESRSVASCCECSATRSPRYYICQSIHQAWFFAQRWRSPRGSVSSDEHIHQCVNHWVSFRNSSGSPNIARLVWPCAPAL